jgi:hypothetical protein
MSVPTPDVSDLFAKDNQALIDAANKYKQDYEKYQADKQYYETTVLAKLQGEIKDPWVFLAMVLQAFTSDGSGATDGDPTKPRADGTITGLNEDKIGLNGDSIAVMAAMTKCGNDIEKASDSRTGTTEDLRQNANAMDILLEETRTDVPSLLNPNMGDSSASPVDPQAIDSYHTQLREIRSDIYNADANGNEDMAGDKDGLYNQPVNLPSSAKDPNWKRTYHLSTLADDTLVSQSYKELYDNSQIQGQGKGFDDPSKGARDAMDTMTNAYQTNTNTTQTMNSGYNLVENNLTKNDQTYLSFISELAHGQSQVMKTVLGNFKS